jgi:hypothetical protein
MTKASENFVTIKYCFEYTKFWLNVEGASGEPQAASRLLERPKVHRIQRFEAVSRNHGPSMGRIVLWGTA